jgi:cyclophilin family peptidyl-prolyl cis-trans isomerase
MTTLCLAIAALLGLCVLPMASALGADTENHPVVVLDTNLGTISIELDRAKAPISVDNFLKYVDSGFYNNTCFHRCIPGFMIQGGGFDASAKTLADGKKTNPPIKNEASNGLKNLRGTIAMARTGDPNSATAQFFINLVDNDGLDRPKPDGHGYAVFGKVTAGMDTVDKIAKVPTAPSGLGEDCPAQPVIIKSATRKRAS